MAFLGNFKSNLHYATKGNPYLKASLLTSAAGQIAGGIDGYRNGDGIIGSTVGAVGGALKGGIMGALGGAAGYGAYKMHNAYNRGGMALAKRYGMQTMKRSAIASNGAFNKIKSTVKG